MRFSNINLKPGIFLETSFHNGFLCPYRPRKETHVKVNPQQKQMKERQKKEEKRKDGPKTAIFPNVKVS